MSTTTQMDLEMMFVILETGKNVTRVKTIRHHFVTRMNTIRHHFVTRVNTIRQHTVTANTYLPALAAQMILL